MCSRIRDPPVLHRQMTGCPYKHSSKSSQSYCFFLKHARKNGKFYKKMPFYVICRRFLIILRLLLHSLPGYGVDLVADLDETLSGAATFASKDR